MAQEKTSTSQRTHIDEIRAAERAAAAKIAAAEKEAAAIIAAAHEKATALLTEYTQRIAAAQEKRLVSQQQQLRELHAAKVAEAEAQAREMARRARENRSTAAALLVRHLTCSQ